MDTMFIWMLSMDPSLSVLTRFDHPLGGGEGYSPIKVTGAAHQKMLRTPLKGTRILFYGRVPNSFQPLRENQRQQIGTANFNSNKDNFQTLCSQRLFESIVINLTETTLAAVMLGFSTLSGTNSQKPLKGTRAPLSLL